MLVRGDRIAAIGAADAIRVSAGTVRVDGRHKYLMPGIAGMHAHVPVRIAVLRSRSWFRRKPRTFVLFVGLALARIGPPSLVPLWSPPG